ncbi:unnamed protein product [Oppiella nova]|uniref:Sushi domain-containing protein n=1 Tax=Oppiella nova TaxID=334625 RepID=A0A7R9M4M4_9ACAR|nr:unnamed protein product [Oppiella nova]CAG2170578.1 unnamed protein product [Oppiella nova]
MRWRGSYPDCVPLKPCPLEHLLVGAHSNQTVVTSMDGLYFYNESQYYAVDGTEVSYGCANPGAGILVGKGGRHCLKTGIPTKRHVFHDYANGNYLARYQSRQLLARGLLGLVGVRYSVSHNSHAIYESPIM